MINKFNKTEYDIALRKKLKKQFNTDLDIEEWEELTANLKTYGIDKSDFLRNAIREFNIKIGNDSKIPKIKFVKIDENGHYVFNYVNSNSQEVISKIYLKKEFTVEECFRLFLKKDVILINPNDLKIK